MFLAPTKLIPTNSQSKILLILDNNFKYSLLNIYKKLNVPWIIETHFVFVFTKYYSQNNRKGYVQIHESGTDIIKNEVKEVGNLVYQLAFVLKVILVFKFCNVA